MSFIVIGGLTGVGFLIRYLAEAKVNYYFNEQLDQHRHKLDILTKNMEYDISKKLFDFEAYANKKHVVYPELYSLIFESWNELTLFSYRFDFEIMGHRNELDTNMLQSRFQDEFAPAMDRLAEAYRYFYKNELYLTKDTAKACNEALEALRTCGREIGISFRVNSNDIERQRQTQQFSPLIDADEKYLQDAEAKIHRLKEIIHKELSYSHSEKPNEQNEEPLS